MPRDYPRTRRVGELLQRELAVLIRDRLKDPDVGMVTLSDVEVSRDLAHAKVYYTVLGDTQVRERTQAALERAAGFLRRELGRMLHLRVIPQLHFVHDDTMERGNRVSALIDQALGKSRGGGANE
ncbi:MAG: 30S ribosome-binding factor RbfA [Gammaproteobacteria bacterium]|nr:MAG: 30S ribosome-binding factor RbfA [Gammaproteobacteria bacterium]